MIDGEGNTMDRTQLQVTFTLEPKKKSGFLSETPTERSMPRAAFHCATDCFTIKWRVRKRDRPRRSISRVPGMGNGLGVKVPCGT